MKKAFILAVITIAFGVNQINAQSPPADEIAKYEQQYMQQKDAKPIKNVVPAKTEVKSKPQVTSPKTTTPKKEAWQSIPTANKPTVNQLNFDNVEVTEEVPTTACAQVNTDYYLQRPVYQVDTTICIQQQRVEQVGGKVYYITWSVYPTAPWRNVLQIASEGHSSQNLYGNCVPSGQTFPLAPYVKHVKILVDNVKDAIGFQYVYQGEILLIEFK